MEGQTEFEEEGTLWKPWAGLGRERGWLCLLDGFRSRVPKLEQLQAELRDWLYLGLRELCRKARSQIRPLNTTVFPENLLGINCQ